MTDPRELHDAVHEAASRVVVGNEPAIHGLIVAALTRGHVLLEGVPGVGKTTLARVFASVSGLETARVQMTPDLLPVDITGTFVYNEDTGEFTLRRGPVFANLVIADEINRATPKTQSALLESMQERQVTIEGVTHQLDEPFMVVATQNPVEMEGTFDLPVAQRDRFQQKLTLDLPPEQTQLDLLDRFDAEPWLEPEQVETRIDPDDLYAAQEFVATVHVASQIKRYIVRLAEATRAHSDTIHGASPRATIALLNTTKAHAALDGREYVIPDDVQAMLPRVFAHRLVLSAEAELNERRGPEIIAEVLEDVDPPGSEPPEEAAAIAYAPDDGE